MTQSFHPSVLYRNNFLRLFFLTHFYLHLMSKNEKGVLVLLFYFFEPQNDRYGWNIPPQIIQRYFHNTLTEIRFSLIRRRAFHRSISVGPKIIL